PAAGTVPIPDVPRLPDAAALARMGSAKSVKSPAGLHGMDERVPPLPPPPPPPPPPPIETHPRISPMNGGGSFLDLATRPNSAVDGDGGRGPAIDIEGGLKEREVRPRKVNGEMEEGVLTVEECLGCLGDLESAATKKEPQFGGRPDADDYERTPESMHDGNESKITNSDVYCGDGAGNARKQGNRPDGSIEGHGHAQEASVPVSSRLSARLRPPPDSPRDVTHDSDPHLADANTAAEGLDQPIPAVRPAYAYDKQRTQGYETHPHDINGEEAEEAELADVFESAYARTLPQLNAYRSPLRTQHSQSMLPFPPLAQPWLSASVGSLALAHERQVLVAPLALLATLAAPSFRR
ncbi:hypothetical protein EW145_g6828, partial [Phellinidium pouzarii]